MAGRPAFRVKASRKDGESITFTDWNGNEQTRKYAPVGSLFANDFGGYNFAADKKFTFNPETHYMSVFPVDDEEGGGERKSSKKPAAKKPARTETEDDGEIDF